DRPRQLWLTRYAIPEGRALCSARSGVSATALTGAGDRQTPATRDALPHTCISDSSACATCRGGAFGQPHALVVAGTHCSSRRSRLPILGRGLLSGVRRIARGDRRRGAGIALLGAGR